MDTALGIAMGLAIGGALVAFCWFGAQATYRVMEASYRFFERLMLGILIKRRIRPDYWGIAMLAFIYQCLSMIYMAIGLAWATSGDQIGLGVFFLALSVWGIASKAWDHAAKPRPIDTPHLLMWWECGRLFPPPYITFG